MNIVPGPFSALAVAAPRRINLCPVLTGGAAAALTYPVHEADPRLDRLRFYPRIRHRAGTSMEQRKGVPRA